ncbi:MAG: cation transporter [Holophagaceae bacterium]|uniref:Cation transporter n=1 Tax=Candidatus Geothrix skivensis TaxID=2954439 RepID=A0A9D7SF63_9BACT|nr:cation transporter [Candidatus Geothrix skivensis]
MKADPSTASWLTHATACLGLTLGGLGLWLGLAEGAVTLWGFGGACLLQIPPALSLGARIREGLGNSGLERERLTLKAVSLGQRFLAMAMAMAAISALLGERSPGPGVMILGGALAALAALAALWFAKRALSGLHPTLALDAARTRTLLELAALLLLGSLLGRWFPWADAVLGLGMALWLFLAGLSLAKASTLQAAACGGCGGGCH